MARDRSGSGYPAGRGDGVVVPADVRDVLDIRRVPDLHLRLLRICNTRTQCKVHASYNTILFNSRCILF